MSERNTHTDMESIKPHRMSEREFITALRKPDKLIASLLLEAGDDVDATDKTLVTKILQKFRYRFTALSFLMMQENMSPDEKLGLVMYVGLVNVADDIVDANPKVVKDTDETKLRADLLAHEVVIKEPIMDGDKNITVQDLYDRTLRKFPQEKQQVIEDFLNQALQAEIAFPNRAPGTYSSDDAFKYRTQTSVAYSRTGSRLIGVDNDSKKMQEFLTWGEVMQGIDDVMDIVPDWRDNAINPLIALARENHESSSIDRLAQESHIEGTVSRLQQGRKLMRSMPHSREQYGEYFRGKLNSLPDSMPKKILSGISGLLI